MYKNKTDFRVGFILPKEKFVVNIKRKTPYLSAGLFVTRDVQSLVEMVSVAEQTVNLLVFLLAFFNQPIGQLRGRRLLIPLTSVKHSLQIVPEGLLIHARLSSARAVSGGRPEARRVWSQNLVNKHKHAVKQAKLKLGIGNENAPCQSILMRLYVKSKAPGAQSGGKLIANQLKHFGKSDVSIVAGFRLC